MSGRCDYAGNAGYFQGSVIEFNPPGAPDDQYLGVPPTPAGMAAPGLGMRPECDERGDPNRGTTPGRKGVVVWSGRGAKLAVQQISDGSSNTIMVAEKAIAAGNYGSEGGDNEEWNNSGWDEDCIRWHFLPTGDNDKAKTPQFKPGTTSTLPWRRNFGSAHSGGLNAVLADGSVRFFRFNVSAETWMRLCVSDDGVAFNPDN